MRGEISGAGNQTYTVSCLNTVALGYHRQDKYDSALYYYNQALELAKKANSSVWTGIVTGNMAQIYYAQKKYESAYPIFLNDYKTSKDSGYYDNAANSLQWAARTNLALGDKPAALKQVREAFELLRLWPDDELSYKILIIPQHRYSKKWGIMIVHFIITIFIHH